MKNVMLKATVMAFAGTCLLAVSAFAAPIVYEATNVKGVGGITYFGTAGYIYDSNQGTYVVSATGQDKAPIFSFTTSEGQFTSSGISDFDAGWYTASITLNGFMADIYDGDNYYQFDLSPIISQIPFVSEPFYLDSAPSMPSGAYGPLEWNIDLQGTSSLIYDFGNTGDYTNEDVNATLAALDLVFSQNNEVNGYMDANIKWDTLKVELNPTAPVPEPATMLLFGTGLAGLAGLRRKKKE